MTVPEYSSSRGAKAITSTKGNRVGGSSSGPGGKDITSAVFDLQALLVEKEQELNEREEAFEKRLRLFDQTNPLAGKATDVLQLNIGGNTKIAVLRSTITQFDGSMLASQFSGRWDDSLAKTKDGDFFIDQDPDLFLKLISYMRLCINQTSDDVPITPPKPSLEFCMMLDHYDLTQALYPSIWRCNWGKISMNENRINNDDAGSYGSIVFTSDSLSGISMVVGQEFHGFRNVTEFSVLVEKGSSAQIGWSTQEALSSKVGYDKSFKCFGLDLNEKMFVAQSVNLEENLDINLRQESLRVRCTYKPEGLTFSHAASYSIEVDGSSDSDPAVKATHVFRKELLRPSISFSGMVTIYGVRYTSHLIE